MSAGLVVRNHYNPGAGWCGMSKLVSIKVSIVEDDAKAREILVDWINRAEGLRCVSDHGSGEDALTALPEHKPQVVLMDINLPGINGIQALSQRRFKHRRACWTFLAAHPGADSIDQRHRTGDLRSLRRPGSLARPVCDRCQDHRRR